ncbi:MAG TPA: NIPSNAP family containing protein, partial [Planctomycetaceae bacterium]|nr:NIPSNAP family containing protein [Planctomycetaceae bacterium]
MKRRDFLAASYCVGWAAPWAASSFAQSSGQRHFFELRQYHLLPGPKKSRFNAFLQEAMIPALNRLGVGPVGAFSPKYGPNKPTLYLLLPHPSLESVLTLAERLLADRQFCQAGAEIVDAPLADPAYLRVESSLLVAFDELPTLQVPSQKKEGKPRIFEL